MTQHLPHFDPKAELADREWFARRPDEAKRIRTTTLAERLRHPKPFAVVTRSGNGRVNLSYEFGEI